MAKKKENLKDLSTEDLTSKIKTEGERYSKLQFTHTISQLENPLSIRSLRRELARMKTELNSRKK